MYNISAKKGRRTKRLSRHIWRVLIRVSILNILILAAGLQLLMADPGIGQKLEDVQITMELQNESLVSAFKTIEQQTDYLFAYRRAQVNSYRVNMERGMYSLEEVLDKILAGTWLEYQVTENKIIVKRNLPVVPVMQITEWVPAAMSGAITGKVIDGQTGEPLPGASVLLQGTQRGDAANAEGEYTIDNVEPGRYTLRATFVGYKDLEKEVTVRDAQTTTVNFSMISAAGELDEMVVVGYGSVQKRDLTGSVSTVSSEEIEATSPTTFEEALAGRVPGVLVRQSNGRPGEGFQINIRGVSSVLGYSQPLYVIDGVPIDTNPEYGAGYDGQFTSRENPLASIDPSDIESIEILKDASAAAIYGSRAASGVVLVTTKRGKRGQKPQISIGYSMTTDRILETYDVLNSEEYREVMTTAANNTNITPMPALVDSILNYSDMFFGGANTNWQDEITRTATTNNLDVSVTGGTDNSTYALSADILDQKGIIMNTGYSRYNIRTNLESDVTDFMTVGTNINYTYSERTGNTGLYAIYNATGFRPDLPVRGSDGEYMTYGGSANPVASLTTDAEMMANNLIGNIFTRIHFIDNLSFTSKLNIGFLNSENSLFRPPEASGGGEATLTAQDGHTLTTTFDNTLQFNKTFAQDHTLDILAGASWYKARDRNKYLEVRGFSNYEFINNISSANTIEGVGGGDTESGLASYFGRLNYNYRQKYYATFTIRADGSSKFGPDNKWGVFPSGALAWNISNEPFLKSTDWINNLKIRASYGKTGLANVPDFLYDTFFRYGSTYNDVNGLSPTAMPNLAIRWQDTKQLDVALDFSFFDFRLNGSVGYFSKNIEDMLMNRPIQPETGFQSQSANVGKMENNGIELEISAEIVRQRDFSLSSSFNITKIHNEITDLEGGQPFASGSTSLVQEGYPLGTIQGYVVEKIFQDQAEIDQLNNASPFGFYQAAGTAPGDYKFRDLNNDGQITSEDQKVLGSIQPDFYGGWTNTLQYKGFELSTLVQFTHGNSKFWEAAQVISQERNVLDYFVDDAWSQDNPDGTDPRIVFNDPNDNQRQSNIFVHDASYVRLKNVRLGYTLPSNLTTGLQVEQINIYASISNLLTITDYPGLDPETSRDHGSRTFLNERDSDEYPLSRSVVLGINIRL